ncbi:hypothetical protein A4H97_16450 [Niastella yeongjuensis]|uniref:Uncharacterized protein n=1 Tax=Niastella yeongjuensis TaxID=354355 RepID=A0A1V9E176_9BACT|nr:hypothetical protein [Niastella yeongjuensis]OQP39811.1 hypothetical protein A4H97_16450 [Niastella yeongjuensis]SEO06259.1 hypothetical protein SAMN05660816_02037 [Niastella yeongjuensis]
MKKLLLLNILLWALQHTICGQTQAADKTQECWEKYDQKTLQLNALQLRSKLITDSLNTLIETLRTNTEHLTKRINRLSGDSAKYQPKIKIINNLEERTKHAEELSANLINDTTGNGFRKLSLIKKTDSINALLAKVNDLTKTSTELEGFKSANNKQLADLKSFYDVSFADLLKITSLDRLKNDSQVFTTLAKETDIPQTLNDLLLFKQAELLLSNKHNKATIESAIKTLQPIINREGTKQLVKLLNDYESLTKNVISTFNQIEKGNVLKAGKTPDLINGKKDKVLRAIEDCVYDNNIDLTRYVYLNQVITAVKKKKMKDVDDDIQEIIHQLETVN